MGFNEVREVRTTYTCDFCKHTEVSVTEYGHSFNIPKGWSALAIVPADQRPDYGMVSNPYPSYSDKPRYCLSGDREMSAAIACPSCSVYGLQVVKKKEALQADAPMPVDPKKARAKAWATTFVWSFVIFWTAVLGFALGWISKGGR